MTLAEKLDSAIALQQAEVDRLTRQVTVDLAAASAQLQALQDARAKITPVVEKMYAAFEQLGIVTQLK